MAVPEQTPYKEYTANGSTTSFALGFICDSKNDLIVLVDGVAPPVATWSLVGNNAVFTTAPASGKKIVLQRNTAMSRTTNYQSNNNSFRPETINKDIDRVWLKLQELGVSNWLMKLYVDRLHREQKEYIDQKDDELKNYLIEEIRKQGIALDQLEDYYNRLMQKLAEIALEGGWTDSVVATWSGRTQEEKNKENVSVSDFISEQNPFDAAIENSPVKVFKGNYAVNNFVNVNSDKPVYMFGYSGLSNIKKSTKASPSLYQLNTTKPIVLKDFKVSLENQDLSSIGSTVAIINNSGYIVDGLDVEGFAGEGSIVQSYTTGGSVDLHNTIKNCKGIGDRSLSTNTNGFLMTNTKFSRLQNLYAEGLAAFAIEFKNNTQHSLMSSNIATKSIYGFGYGQTTSDDTGVSYSLATDLISLNNSMGFIGGKAKYNLTANVIYHNTTEGAVGLREGIRLTSNSNYNAFYNQLFVGDFSYPIRLQSNYNYISGSFFNSNNTNAVLTEGAKGNVINIDHAGDKTSILSSITDNSGSTGADRNVAYCHATGEYSGTRSGRWRWQHEKTLMGLPAATHKWIYEGLGTCYQTIHTDGTGAAGFAVSTASDVKSFAYVYDSAYWRLDVGTGGYRFYSSTFRPTVDNTASLGSSAQRFTTIYATTGAINTSDERLKQQFRSQTQREKDAALEIKNSISLFKFNDAVDLKGDGARWHVGVKAQQVISILESHDLDPFEYAFVCFDEWDEQEEIIESWDAEYDDDGNLVREAGSQVTQEYREAGSRYAIRYDELSMFVISAM